MFLRGKGCRWFFCIWYNTACRCRESVCDVFKSRIRGKRLLAAFKQCCYRILYRKVWTHELEYGNRKYQRINIQCSFVLNCWLSLEFALKSNPVKFPSFGQKFRWKAGMSWPGDDCIEQFSQNSSQLLSVQFQDGNACKSHESYLLFPQFNKCSIYSTTSHKKPFARIVHKRCTHFQSCFDQVGRVGGTEGVFNFDRYPEEGRRERYQARKSRGSGNRLTETEFILMSDTNQMFCFCLPLLFPQTVLFGENIDINSVSLRCIDAATQQETSECTFEPTNTEDWYLFFSLNGVLDTPFHLILSFLCKIKFSPGMRTRTKYCSQEIW